MGKKKPLAKLVHIRRETGDDGNFFAITDKMCTFGRGAKCDIRIQIPQVPAEQCQLTMDNTGKATLKNLNSEFPTKVNGNEVNSHVLLKHGDRVTIFNRCYRYESSSAAYEDILKADLRNPLGSITPNNDQREEKQKKTKDISHDMVKETPKKKKKKSLRSKAITKTISVEHQENVTENSCQIKTPNKKKRRSIANLKKDMTVSGEKVLAKETEITKESSVIASEIPSKKKSTSIAVDQKETVSGENVSAEATKLKESVVLETKTPTKKIKKKRKSMAVGQEKTIAPVENTLAEAIEVVKDYSINQLKTPNKTSKKKRKSMTVGQEKNITSVENGPVKANHIIKESSVIETPNKTSKNKRKSMAVLNEKTTVCETKVVNKVKDNKVKNSELQIETSNKKKRRSIVVVKKEMAVSEKYVSAEETELKKSSAMETKTPTKPSKKKRKSMAVDQEKIIVSAENNSAEETEVVKATELVEECVNESKTKKIKRKSTLVKIGYTQKNKMEKGNTKEKVQSINTQSKFQEEEITNENTHINTKC